MILDPAPGTLVEPETGRRRQRDEVMRQVAARVRRYRREGIEAGDRVSIHFGNRLEFFAELLAVWRVGGCAIPVDGRLTAFRGQAAPRRGPAAVRRRRRRDGSGRQRMSGRGRRVGGPHPRGRTAHRRGARDADRAPAGDIDVVDDRGLLYLRDKVRERDQQGRRHDLPGRRRRGGAAVRRRHRRVHLRARRPAYGQNVGMAVVLSDSSDAVIRALIGG